MQHHLYDKHLGQGWRNYTFSRLQTNIRVHGSTLRIQLDTKVSSGIEYRLGIRFKLKVQGSAWDRIKLSDRILVGDKLQLKVQGSAWDRIKLSDRILVGYKVQLKVQVAAWDRIKPSDRILVGFKVQLKVQGSILVIQLGIKLSSGFRDYVQDSGRGQG